MGTDRFCVDAGRWLVRLCVFAAMRRVPLVVFGHICCVDRVAVITEERVRSPRTGSHGPLDVRRNGGSQRSENDGKAVQATARSHRLTAPLTLRL